MSNLTKLLEVAGNVAFSNLFEIEVGTAQSVKDKFRLHVENISIPGMNLNFAIEASTKKNYIQSSTKIRELKLRVRETSGYYFYEYLLSWYKDFYDPITNRFRAGDNANSGIGKEIVKTRILYLKAYSSDESKPPFVIHTNSAMLQNLPSINFDYSNSKPITYDVTFIVNNVDMTVGNITSATTNTRSVTNETATTQQETEETIADYDKYVQAQAAK